MRQRAVSGRRLSTRVSFDGTNPHSGQAAICRTLSRRLRSGVAIAAPILLLAMAGTAAAQDTTLPTGGMVTAGSAAIATDGASLNVTQTSPTAIIGWSSFSIGGAATAHFDNGSGATLNRVGGNVPSRIDGLLTATGSLFLVNPAGITVGTGGMVATGGSFVGSTHDVSDADFLGQGAMAFSGTSKAGIVNHGTITSAFGDVALIARRVENDGEIAAPNGTAALLAGYDVLMQETSGENGKFAVRVGGADTEVVNSGAIRAAAAELRANGGNVLALAGNTKGVIKATGVEKSGGRIFLTAGGGKVVSRGRVSAKRHNASGGQDGGEVVVNAGAVSVGGLIDAAGSGGKGGKVDIGGRDIALEGAQIDASGSTGGGRIRVGGEFQGGRGLASDEVENAATLAIDAASTLKADGTGADADGGMVIAWADGTTSFAGSISATGAHGGFAEVSGKVRLGYSGFVDLHGRTGANGTLLLDPTDLTIGAVEAAAITATLGASNVVVSTSPAGGGNGDIFVDSQLEYDSANDLTLLAHRHIQANASIQNEGTGDLTLVAGWDGTTLSGFLADPGSYGNGGDVLIGDGNQTDDVNVGTWHGDLNVFARNLEVRGSDAQDYARARLGAYVAGSGDPDGDITVRVKGDVIVQGGSRDGSTAAIGHTINDGSGDVAGDITIVADNASSANSVIVVGGDGERATARIGHENHGGSANGAISITSGDVLVGTDGSGYADGDDATSRIGHDAYKQAAGNITIDAANDFAVEGGDGEDAYSSVGHEADQASGDIMVTAGGDVSVEGGDEGASVQVGHYVSGNYDDQPFASGRIDIEAAGDMWVSGGFGDYSPAQVGHAGDGDATGDITIAASELTVQGGDGNYSEAQIGHSNGFVPLWGSFPSTITGDIDVDASGLLAVVGGSGLISHAQIGHGHSYMAATSIDGDIDVASGSDLAVIGGSRFGASAQIGHGGKFNRSPLSGDILVDATDNILVLGGTGLYTSGRIGHGGYSQFGDRDGDITVTSHGAGLSLPFSTILVGSLGGFESMGQIGHGGAASFGASRGDISVSMLPGAMPGAIGLLGGFGFGSTAQIGHGGRASIGFFSGDIDVTSPGALALIGGFGFPSYAMIGHGDAAQSSIGKRQGDITVVAAGEASLQDGLNPSSVAWIGHQSAFGAISDADVSLQAFGFDRSLFGSVAPGALGSFNKDIIEADIPYGDFTLVATGTGLAVDDPVYNSPFRLLMAVNDDLVLNFNATFVNAGTGHIVLAAGGDFHNDTGSLTPIVTGGRWLVYSTRPDDNRNDIEITNWDFLRYSTPFDINDPVPGAFPSGNGLIYSVTPVVNFTVADQTIDFGQPLVFTVGRNLTVNGVAVDPLAFGLGIRPVIYTPGLAAGLPTDAAGNPLTGFWAGGLTIRSVVLPWFGMQYTVDPGDLTVIGGGNNDRPVQLGQLVCRFVQIELKPDASKGGEEEQRPTTLCGIIESVTP